MAVVIAPLHSSEARGSVGSLQYNSWRGRATVRTRSGPAIGTQYTDARLAIRAMAANATSAWQAMTDLERTAWTHYANTHPDPDWTGSPKRLTGYNWFLRINVRRQLLGESLEDAPPTETVTVRITNLYIVADGFTSLVNWETMGAYDEDTTGIEVYLTGAHSAGANPTIKQAKRIEAAAIIVLSLALPTTWNLWYTVFARPVLTNGVVGSWASYKFQAPEG